MFLPEAYQPKSPPKPLASPDSSGSTPAAPRPPWRPYDPPPGRPRRGAKSKSKNRFQHSYEDVCTKYGWSGLARGACGVRAGM